MSSAAIKIRDFTPKTNVVNHLRIDLDLAEITKHMHFIDTTGEGTDPYFGRIRRDLARRVYEQGGHACIQAELTVPPLAWSMKAGDHVFQSRPNDWRRSAALRASAPIGSTRLTVEYSSLWRPCFGGGSSESTTTGAYGVELNLTAHCLDKETSLHSQADVIGIPLAVSHEFQTLAAFSTTATDRMKGEDEFELYQSFFGSGDYAHVFIINAFDPNQGEAVVPPASYPFFSGEIARKTLVFMTVWMEVVHQMNTAIDRCQDGDAVDGSTICVGVECESAAVHAWEKAAAYYAGSSWDDYASSIMLDAEASHICRVFGTCNNDGVALVNHNIFKHFTLGQHFLANANCGDLIAEKGGIVRQMYVPLVQNLLQAAYALSTEADIRRDRTNGAFFGKTLQPVLQKCDPKVADLITENMFVGVQERPMISGFANFKRAIEKAYPCMGLTCQDIGGILLPKSPQSGYVKGAEPCGMISSRFPHANEDPGFTSAASETGMPLWIPICIAVAGIIVSFIGGYAAWRRGFNKGRCYEKFVSERQGATGVLAETVGKTEVRTVLSISPTH